MNSVQAQWTYTQHLNPNHSDLGRSTQSSETRLWGRPPALRGSIQKGRNIFGVFHGKNNRSTGLNYFLSFTVVIVIS